MKAQTHGFNVCVIPVQRTALIPGWILVACRVDAKQKEAERLDEQVYLCVCVGVCACACVGVGVLSLSTSLSLDLSLSTSLSRPLSLDLSTSFETQPTKMSSRRRRPQSVRQQVCVRERVATGQTERIDTPPPPPPSSSSLFFYRLHPAVLRSWTLPPFHKCTHIHAHQHTNTSGESLQ